VFEQTPELSNIGSQQQYSRYLDTIFPESKLNNIYRHGTSAVFDKFDLKYFGKTDTGDRGYAFYFSPDLFSSIGLDPEADYAYVKYVLLNSVNPYYRKEGINPEYYFNRVDKFDDVSAKLSELESKRTTWLSKVKNKDVGYGFFIDFSGDKNNIEELTTFVNDKIDSQKESLLLMNSEVNKMNPKAIGSYDSIVVDKFEVAIADPNNIHILGSKEDINGFKKFISENKIQYFQADPRDENAKLRSSHLKGFIGFKGKTVSPQQKINALKRLEIYNKKYNTSHHITFDRVGESMNYTWSIDEKWNAFDPTQGLLFELPKTTPSNEKIEELNQKLITMLSAMGVTVEQFNNFKEEYGLDAVGVMEIIDGVARIRFDESRTDKLTLPEETAHFFIELFGDSQIAQRLIESMKANDYYKVVLGEEYESYEKQYNGDINKLAKEGAGKLLAQAIVARFKQEELQIPQASYNLLQRFWNYIKNVFSKVSQVTTNRMISDLYNEVAASILSNEYSHLRLQNIKGRQVYFQISDMALNRLKSALNKTVETTAKRIQILKAKSKTIEAFKDSEYLETLVESLDNDTYVKSALSYAEFARTKFKRVNDAVIALRKKFADLDLGALL